MNNPFYKNCDILYVILGNAVVKCQVAHNEKVGDKHLQLLFNDTKIYKQKSYCFQSEIEALDNLREKLEKSLKIINSRIDKLLNDFSYQVRNSGGKWLK